MTVALQRWDYTAVGHVTIDVMQDGSRRAGGTALYSALQASRLGLRTLVVTRGVVGEIEALLAPYAGEFDLDVLPAPETTTLRTSGSGVARAQRLLAWAGPLPETLEIDSAILHLAPVARETPAGWSGEADRIGLTPQGMARAWAGPGELMTLTLPPASAVKVAAACHAIVLSEQERESCSALIAAAGAAEAVVAITDGADASTVLAPGGAVAVEVPPIALAVDDVGAGDVFAAAFFVALAEERTPLEATEFATAAAAVRMARRGIDAVGDRRAILARLAAVRRRSD